MMIYQTPKEASVSRWWSSTLGTMVRTESQRTSSVNHSLVVCPLEPLLFVPERRTVESVVNVGEEIAVLARRRDELGAASVERMVQEMRGHFKAFQLAVEVTVGIGLEDFVEAHLLHVVLTDDADLSSGYGFGSGQGP